MSSSRRLLFVCSGNICRSPMAEVLSEAIGAEVGVTVHARSAGTLGLQDRPADPKAVRVCRELGLDLRAHRSQGVTDALVAWADHILVMELAHASHLRSCFDVPEDKLLLLGPFAGVPEIDDPIGGWVYTFRRNRKLLERAIRAYFARS